MEGWNGMEDWHIRRSKCSTTSEDGGLIDSLMIPTLQQAIRNWKSNYVKDHSTFSLRLCCGLLFVCVIGLPLHLVSCEAFFCLLGPTPSCHAIPPNHNSVMKVGVAPSEWITVQCTGYSKVKHMMNARGAVYIHRLHVWCQTATT